MTVQYVTDKRGHQTAVVVPIDDWTRLNDKLLQLQKKLSIFQDIQSAFHEVDEFSTGKKPKNPIETLFHD